jgi:hypothetical protein
MYLLARILVTSLRLRPHFHCFGMARFCRIHNYEPLLEDALLNLLIVNALRLSHDFADLARDGYSQDSFYGDEGGWTRDNRIEAKVGYFWRLGRLCMPWNYELRLRLISKLYDSLSFVHVGVGGTLAKSCDRLWWKRIRPHVEDFCKRRVVCRRAKIQPQMAATLNPLHVPPVPWHSVGLDYLTHLHMSNGFESVLIVVGHLTRIAHFLPCRESVTTQESASLFYSFFTWSPRITWTAPGVD